MADVAVPVDDEPVALSTWTAIPAPYEPAGGGSTPALYLENGRLKFGVTVPPGARLVAFEP